MGLTFVLGAAFRLSTEREEEEVKLILPVVSVDHVKKQGRRMAAEKPVCGTVP